MKVSQFFAKMIDGIHVCIAPVGGHYESDL